MAEEAGGGGGPARQRRGGSPKDRAPAREREAEAWRAEVRGQLAALLEQVAERQQSFEESLRGWIGAELAERMQEVARARDDWEADRWENQNFIEHLAQRLKHVESSLSAASERRAIGPHPLAEMGRRLAPHGDASPPVRLLQESSRLVEARLTALEVSFGGLGGLGAVPEELQDLRSRVACLEERWARQPPPPAAARPSAGRRPPSSDPGRCSRRSEAACSARSGDNRSGAAQGRCGVPAAVGAASLLVAGALAAALSGRPAPSPPARASAADALGLVGFAGGAEGRRPALRALSNKSNATNATNTTNATLSREEMLNQLIDKLEGLHKTLDRVDNMARLMVEGYHLGGLIYCYDLNATVCGNPNDLRSLNATGSICCAPTATCCGKPTAQICCGEGNTCCPNGLCVQKPEHCLTQ